MGRAEAGVAGEGDGEGEPMVGISASSSSSSSSSSAGVSGDLIASVTVTLAVAGVQNSEVSGRGVSGLSVGDWRVVGSLYVWPGATSAMRGGGPAAEAPKAVSASASHFARRRMMSVSVVDGSRMKCGYRDSG